MIWKNRTSAEWFAEAARCYIENHQGCAWCGGSYRVFHTSRDSQNEYYCHGCDFRAAHDAADDDYLCYPGENCTAAKSKTMTAL